MAPPPLRSPRPQGPIAVHHEQLRAHLGRYDGDFFAPGNDDEFSDAAARFWEAGEVERAYTQAQLTHQQTTATLATNVLLAQQNDLLAQLLRAVAPLKRQGGENLALTTQILQLIEDVATRPTSRPAPAGPSRGQPDADAGEPDDEGDDDDDAFEGDDDDDGEELVDETGQPIRFTPVGP